MNKMRVENNKIPTENKVNMAVKKLIDQERATREKSAQILDYYRDGRQRSSRV